MEKEILEKIEAGSSISFAIGVLTAVLTLSMPENTKKGIEEAIRKLEEVIKNHYEIL